MLTVVTKTKGVAYTYAQTAGDSELLLRVSPGGPMTEIYKDELRIPRRSIPRAALHISTVVIRSIMKTAALTLTAVTISAAMLTACSTGPATNTQPIDPFKVLAGRSATAAGSFSMAPTSLAGALPNVTYTLLGEGNTVIVSAPFSDAVLTGHFTSSEVYSSTIWNEDDSSTAVGENDPADTRVLNVQFASDEVISHSKGTTVPENVTVAVKIPGDVDPKAIGQGLIDMGEAVLFLEKPNKAPEGAGWTIALGGTLIGQVSADGDVTFPVMTQLEDASSLGSFSQVEDQSTLSELRKAAALPDSEVVG